MLIVSLRTCCLCLSIGISASEATACDETQLAVQFIGFYQKGDVKVCAPPHNREESYDRDDPCPRAFVSTNSARATQIIDFTHRGSGYDLKEVYHTWAFAHSTDTEVVKHLDGCPDYGSYLRVARHMVSCYPHATGGAFIGYGNMSPPEAQAIGINTCVTIGQ
jgi:hypothetical protein